MIYMWKFKRKYLAQVLHADSEAWRIILPASTDQVIFDPRELEMLTPKTKMAP